MKRSIPILFALLMLVIAARAQVTMTTTGSYFQDFNTLINTGTGTWTDNSTLSNWYAQRSGTGTSIAADAGSSTAGNLYSYGPTGDTDRALGSIGSGNTAAGNFAWGILLQNTSGVAITSLSIAYVGEQWRNSGAGAAQTVAFYYQISASPITALDPANNGAWTAVTALDFISPVATGTATALDGNAAANRTIVGAVSIPSLTIPDGSYIMLKWDDPNQVGNDHGLSIDSVSIAWTVVTGGTTITTGTISGSPFCVNSTTSAPVDVPYTISGTYNPGNEFQAYLSDASGSFASETLIGTLISENAGTISATIPAGTPTGGAYRIRVKAIDPVTTGTDNLSNFWIFGATPTVANATALPASGQVTLNWDNPAGCTDELMIVAQPISSIVQNASGDGIAYTANSQDFTDPLNSDFDVAGKVVFKQITPGTSATITGLTNGTPYYFRFFSRQGTDWNQTVEVNATPLDLPSVVITEIMYNDPSTGAGGDSLEFIEFYNNDLMAVDMSKWSMSGVTHVFAPGTVLNAGEYLVLAKDTNAMNNFFGITGTVQWTTGALTNTGEYLALLDSLGNVIDSLTYEDSSPWPSAPNGTGPSLTFCDPMLDNSVPGNWSASDEYVDSLNMMPVYATPGTGCLIVPDTLAPVPLNAFATSLSSVTVIFNEDLGSVSAENIANYNWLTAATGNAALLAGLDTVILTLSTPLVTAVTDTLSISGIADILGNTMTMTYKFPIVYGTIIPSVDTIVYWNFPNNPDDQTADGGLPVNLGKIIIRDYSFTGTFAYVAGAPGTAISSTGWDNGTGTKYWMLDFSTWSYDSIRVSSKQRSSDTGPRDFRLEYSIDGMTWTTVTDITVLNNFTSGVVSSVLLPSDADSKPWVTLRWLIVSDSSVLGATVASAGTSRIDEIYVTGRYNPILNVDCKDLDIPAFSLYPNPTDASLFIRTERSINAEITVLSMTGQVLMVSPFKGIETQLDLSELPDGMYFIRMTDLDHSTSKMEKVMVY